MMSRCANIAIPLSAAIMFKCKAKNSVTQAKSSPNKLPDFDFKKYKKSQDGLQRERNENDCVVNGDVFCAGGKYADEQATDWKLSHDSLNKNDSLKVWNRKRLNGETEYRLYSNIENIYWQDFLEVQLNCDYRKEWDSWVQLLEPMQCENDKEGTIGEACVYKWVQKMPGALLKSREYTYLREVFHFPEDRTVIIAARDVPGVDSENKTVKVENYQSVMVIKYAENDEKGFSYLLTYHDDVSKILPGWFQAWANGRGARSSHDKIISKCLELEKRREQKLGFK
ncbi:unnamed protein product [Oikopleura dioica]|uniref:START domain-containing protein n=1 Tax=Oikopleura dioica TaxID=34765 RepID=E4X4Z5_OIKDI|nr:unnamed protein product [Oikopleura dioica]